jgi:hypothetical protein
MSHNPEKAASFPKSFLFSQGAAPNSVLSDCFINQTTFFMKEIPVQMLPRFDRLFKSFSGKLQFQEIKKRNSRKKYKVK